MSDIRFDFNNMLAANIGPAHGVTEEEIGGLSQTIQAAHRHIRCVLADPLSRVNVSMEWSALPLQDKKSIRSIQVTGGEIACKYENVLFLGIGGSYLGLKSAQDALLSPYYNEFKDARGGRARIYFEGNNLDPGPPAVLLKNLDSKKTFVVVISKSGETTETKAVFDVVENWLKKGVGPKYGRSILAITDPKSGSLRKRVDLEQGKDLKSFRSLPLLKGVGGRFSEFNMGLLHLAIAGIKIDEVLAGARDMSERCSASDLYKNPAYLYAILHYLAYTKKSKTIAILMPFSEGLKSTADWYCQLLAESLGKKYERKINISASGAEEWVSDISKIVNVGRTPIASRGTTDLHSIQQNNVEGENNKAVTMIRVERFKNDKKVPKDGGVLSGKSFGELLKLAQEATEWALVRDERPNCTVSLPEIDPYTWGALLYFFEMATAFEGELLNVNAFDQPGVESYKNYMYYKLAKPGIPRTIADEIQNHPVKRDPRYIL
ncbi:MAG TPA: glucose-6-phosphate isomerase [Candidatus Omnitrophica bacterium]|nr:glucose-6-phosphate isomerase [Candidatus Omnitrophota bacterium]